jgi:hypothetical protein
VASVNTTYLANHCTHKAETDIVVAITRRVVVPIPRTQVLRIVVPTAATYNAVRAPYGHYAKPLDRSKSLRRRFNESAWETWAITLLIDKSNSFSEILPLI